MSEAELIFTALAEMFTREIAENMFEGVRFMVKRAKNQAKINK